MQGTFVEAAAPAPVSMQLAAAVLELLASPPVGAHAQPYVRRAAIVTASQVPHSPAQAVFLACHYVAMPQMQRQPSLPWCADGDCLCIDGGKRFYCRRMFCQGRFNGCPGADCNVLRAVNACDPGDDGPVSCEGGRRTGGRVTW